MKRTIPQILSAVTSVVSACTLLLASTGCGEMEPVLGTEVNISVNGTGNGRGNVTDNDFDVSINCTVVAGVTEGKCSDQFADAGGGGNFALTANPFIGSLFVNWANCSSTNNADCILDFTADAEEVDFNVTVTFNRDPQNACNAAFGNSNGYVLCAESASTCTFYTFLNDVDSCTSRCAAFGSTCVSSFSDSDNTCQSGRSASCNDVVGDRLCECSKPEPEEP